jgi:uncharacterized membrane protein
MISPFRVCAITFAAMIFMLLASAFGATWALHSGVSESIRAPFSFFCHGIASHSFALGGTPMPLCARCVGIYAGSLVGIGLAAATRSSAFRLSTNRLFIALVPILLDGGSQALRLRESNNPLRFVTGFVAGMAFLLWVLQQIREGREVDSRESMPESAAPAPHTNG